MPTFEEALPALFGSLRPDKSKLLSDAVLSAKEAEQKWPLLRGVSPNNHEQPPALSDEERQNWNTTGNLAIHNAPKPALSLPGMGEKIAKGLENFSVLPSNAVSPKITATVEKRSLTPGAHSSSIADHKTSAKATSAFVAPSTFPFIHAKTQATNTLAVPDIPINPASTTSEKSKPTTARESLAEIFSRLEGKKRPKQRSPSASASFLGRLGKR
jgi:hypothetical protein